MNDLFKIVVYVLERLLHSRKPLFGNLKFIDIVVSDGIRTTNIHWSDRKGVELDEP